MADLTSKYKYIASQIEDDFYGKIELSVQAGKIKNIKIKRSEKVDWDIKDIKEYLKDKDY